MSKKSSNLHDGTSNRSSVAVLLIDVINDLAFPGHETLLPHAELMAENLSQLCTRARELHIPVIYVNDNFGRWRSDLHHQVDRCLNEQVPGRPIVQKLIPKSNDYFILKPKHSGFYCTSLDLLLGALGVETLILTGLVTNICVLFTANDAYMRDYKIWVPQDCCAAVDQRDHKIALKLMQDVLKAEIPSSSEIDFESMKSGQ